MCGVVMVHVCLECGFRSLRNDVILCARKVCFDISILRVAEELSSYKNSLLARIS